MALQNWFTTVLNMTVTGSIITAVVLLARLALGKGPKVFSWWLWMVVLFRLLCPVSVSAPVSVLGAVDAPPAPALVGRVEYVQAPAAAPTLPAAPAVLAEPKIDWEVRLAQVWAVGAGAMALYGCLSYGDLKRRLRQSVPAGKGVREADGIRTPFVLGFFRPVIYLPAGTADREYILLHERFHIRHGDPLVKGIFWLALCLHWFNPLVWLAFVLCGRDMELRCDEAVLKKLGRDARSDYAQALLSCAAGRRLAPTPLAFCEGDTEKRVKHVLRWKRGKWWAAVLAAALCITVLVLSACNPYVHQAETQRVFDNRYRAEAVLGEGDSWIYYPRTYDFQLCRQHGGEQMELGKLTEKRLDSGFALSDRELERQLREENDLAWRTGEYWLMYQKDGGVYLTQGRDRVLKLDRIRNMGVRVRTQGYFGYSYDMADYPIGSGQWTREKQNVVDVSREATLVWTQCGEDKTLTVVEEYHQMGPDGAETVTETAYTLEQNRDYGYELPICRRGQQEGDWAMYRVDLGLSSYVFYVRFGLEVPERVCEVRFCEGGGNISLRLPEGWSYAITSLQEDDYSAGIVFWPTGREEGVLRLDYYPQRFGVCGTGLETETMVLAGREVTVGTYDGHPLWDYICFDEHFALWGEGHERWWEEFGEQAMEILNTAQFGTRQDAQ